MDPVAIMLRQALDTLIYLLETEPEIVARRDRDHIGRA
jgi:hypothetical protein